MIDDNDFEDQIEDLILENGILTQALINLLIKKGILTQEEIADEVQVLYGEADDGELPLQGLAEFESDDGD